MTGIADTGFLVAFANRNDAHHRWAVDVAAQIDEPLLTCEAVLAEAAFHLQSVPIVLAMIAEGLVTVSFAANEHLPQLAVLAKRYQDRSPDLADLCIVRMSELYPRHPVITVDRDDFRVYRRNKREMIDALSARWPGGLLLSRTALKSLQSRLGEIFDGQTVFRFECRRRRSRLPRRFCFGHIPHAFRRQAQ